MGAYDDDEEERVRAAASHCNLSHPQGHNYTSEPILDLARTQREANPNHGFQHERQRKRLQ
eukprot:647670-Amphidinium_carterae.1